MDQSEIRTKVIKYLRRGLKLVLCLQCLVHKITKRIKWLQPKTLKLGQKVLNTRLYVSDIINWNLQMK